MDGDENLSSLEHNTILFIEIKFYSIFIKKGE